MTDKFKNCPLQNISQELGVMTLCGVLHVAYQAARDKVAGDFMVCTLFNRYLLFAKGVDDLRRLEAVACVCLDKVRIDVLQNGRGMYKKRERCRSWTDLPGLCCYGCMFSWKLLFQHQDASYEFVLSASSASEERYWNTEILRLSAALAESAQPRAWAPETHSFSTLPLTPLDQIQYQVSSLARRSCMDSVSTAPRSQVQHVVIKKTHYPRHVEEPVAQAEGEIERPKTPPEGNFITLVARRIDRIRLERLIAEVWPRDLLPTPGMVLGRGDLFRRRPLMEKLSIHTAFHRRSASVGEARKPSSEVRSEHEGENKEIGRSSDGFDDREDKDVEIQSHNPTTPTTPERRRTLLFKGSSKTTSPHSETDGIPDPAQSPKKWSSPKSLFSALASKKLKKPRSQAD